MPRAFCLMGLAVALLLFVLFAIDLAVGIPFGRASLLADIGFVVSSLGLGLISFTTLKGLK